MYFLHLLVPLAGLVLTSRLVIVLLRWFSSPLRSVPGPFLARFTDGWYAWRVSRGHFETDNLALHQKYGPIVRYGPNRFSVSDLDASKTIYGHGARFPKSSWYSSWTSPGAWSIFTDQSIKRHAQNRKLYQHTYSMTSLVTYEPYVDECADLFGQHLAEWADRAAPVDIGHWFQCYAFDVIGSITYGRRLGFLDQGSDIGGVIRALEDHLVYATLIGIYPRWHRPLHTLLNLWAGKNGSGRTYVMNFTKERVEEHRRMAMLAGANVPKQTHVSSDGAEPFLTKFMAKHAEDPTVFTAQHINIGLAANMVAGSDTTAITLSAILYNLLVSPESLAKVREEIETFQAQGKLSWPPTFSESQQMPYLQAVLKEALRMHPATGLPLERVVPEGGATICGRFFPAESIVGINTWVEHRNPLIYGEDADAFRPERWLSGDEQSVALMNRHWMPFGLGSRTCIGRHISWLEISKLVPRILHEFEFELSEGEEGHGTWETNNYWFVKPKNFKVNIARRRVPTKNSL